MTPNPLCQLESILQGFDDRTDAFPLHELSGAINALAAQAREAGGPIPTPLLAEQIAFELIPDYGRKGFSWGTYYGPVMEFAGTSIPELNSITEEVITYWVSRARSSRHPLMRVRYADVAWDFSRKVARQRCPHDIPRLIIAATIELVSRNLSPHKIDGIWYLRRALSVAILLNDPGIVDQVRDTIIAFEDQVAVDHFPGLWGFSFDLLIRENRKIPLRDEQRGKIIGDLESRLRRLADVANSEELEITHVESASLRLADYYRRQSQTDDLRRVMTVFANVCVRKAVESKNWPAASGWLERVHELLLSFGLTDEAKAIQPHYRQAAQSLRDAMPAVQVSLPVDAAALEDFISGFTNGTPDQILGTIVGHFLPRREEEQRRLEEIMKGSVVFDFVTSTLVDDTGRTVSQVGPLGSDPEGNLIRHVANMMDYGSFFLRAVIDRVVTTEAIDVNQVMNYVNKSEIFDPDRHSIIENALAAYFAHNWLIAIHLLGPQIEHVIRRFVGMTGGATVKKGKNGGLLLRNLDELLRDERIEGVYGSDGAFYLRVLLTDQRGWNVRNDVAHGITLSAAFNSRTADRLFHALLLVGTIRRRSPEEESPAAEAAPK